MTPSLIANKAQSAAAAGSTQLWWPNDCLHSHYRLKGRL